MGFLVQHLALGHFITREHKRGIGKLRELAVKPTQVRKSVLGCSITRTLPAASKDTRFCRPSSPTANKAHMP